MIKWNLFTEVKPTKSGSYFVLVRYPGGSYSLKTEYWFDGIYYPFKPVRKLSDDLNREFEHVSDGYAVFVEYDYDTHAWHEMPNLPWEPIAWISCRELVDEMVNSLIFGKEGTK